MTDGAVSHDRITRFLASEELDSAALWRLVKPMVRQLEDESEHGGVLIIELDTIEEKPYTDESELVCWHYDHSKGRSVKGINLISALYQAGDASIPVAFELVKKSEWVFNDKRMKFQRKSPRTMRTARIAEELGCHPKTVRKRLHRFNALGIDGLGDRPGAGRKPRITEDERSKIIALVSKDPPGRLVRYDGLPPEALDEKGAAYWTLDALAEAAQGGGIEVRRSQVRRILLREGVRWRRTRPWAESADPEFVPKGRRSSSYTRTRHPAAKPEG